MRNGADVAWPETSRKPALDQPRHPVIFSLAMQDPDEERTRHAEQFPDWPLPEKRERLTRRDWRLPRPPF